MLFSIITNEDHLGATMPGAGRVRSGWLTIVVDGDDWVSRYVATTLLALRDEGHAIEFTLSVDYGPLIFVTQCILRHSPFVFCCIWK